MSSSAIVTKLGDVRLLARDSLSTCRMFQEPLLGETASDDGYESIAAVLTALQLTKYTCAVFTARIDLTTLAKSGYRMLARNPSFFKTNIYQITLNNGHSNEFTSDLGRPSIQI
jgi:hypothetical protein